jgi:WD40 repeat protein
VRFTKEGKRVLVRIGIDGAIKAWDLATGEQVFSLHASLLTVGPNGERLAGTIAGCLKVWDMQTGHELVAIQAHSDDVVGLAFLPDNNRLAMASRDGKVEVWDTATRERVLNFKPQDNEFASCQLSPDGGYLLTIGKE